MKFLLPTLNYNTAIIRYRKRLTRLWGMFRCRA